MKPILPSLREKKRYILYEIVSENKGFKKMEIENMINNKILQFLGEKGYAKMNLMFMDNWGNKGIIKVNNKEVDNTKAALMLAEKINDEKILIKSVKVSGSLKKLKGYKGG